MKEKNPFKINFAFLSGSIIVFILLMMPPFLEAFTFFNPQGEIELKAELKAQEINPWIDEPIEEFNDLTLRQVFENGQLSEGVWFTFSSSISENTNEIIEWISSGTTIFSLIRNTYNNSINVGDIYYVNGSIRALTDNISSFRIQKIGNNVTVQDNPIPDIWYDYSFLQVSTDQDVEEFRALALLTTSVSGKIAQITKPLILNLTELGIDNLTQEQMDYYYDRYLRYKDSTINDYTTVMNNTLQLAPFINPLELVSKSIEFYTEIVVDTYTTISNVWNSASEWLSLTIDISPVEAMEIYDKWWFKPFQWLIGD